jgi:hypothetical protein
LHTPQAQGSLSKARGATGEATFAFGYATQRQQEGQPFLLGLQRTLCPVRNRQQSTFACLWRLLATYARCASAREAQGDPSKGATGTTFSLAYQLLPWPLARGRLKSKGGNLCFWLCNAQATGGAQGGGTFSFGLLGKQRTGKRSAGLKAQQQHTRRGKSPDEKKILNQNKNS